MAEEEDFKEIELIRVLIDKVSSTYHVSPRDVIKLLSKPEDSIDAAAFSNKRLAPTEALVKYLRENKYNKLSDIARFLKRSQNTIQTTYSNAQAKQAERITFAASGVKVPLSVFSNKKLTVLESLVRYLREEENMTNKEIAKLTGKSNKTIWTVYERAKVKG